MIKIEITTGNIMETTATMTKAVGYAIAAYLLYKIGLEVWCIAYGFIYN